MKTEPITIAMINQKGGVGKTSTCFHLTTSLVERGQRVLLVDFDPQANLTRGIIGAQDAEAIPVERTAAALFSDTLDPDPDDLLLETPYPGIHLLPGSWEINNYDYPNPTDHGNYQYCLREFLGEVQDRFDVILIDCRPSLNLLSWNALLASEFVVVPFQPEDYGAQGIVFIQQVIDQAIAGPNPRLRLLGYLLNKVTRRSLHKTFESVLRNYYGDDVFEVTIPDAAQFPEAVSHRLPIGLYKKRGKPVDAMRAVTTEIFERVDRVRKAQPRFLYMGNRTGSGRSSSSNPNLRQAG